MAMMVLSASKRRSKIHLDGAGRAKVTNRARYDFIATHVNVSMPGTQEEALSVICSCLRGISWWFTPLACGPGFPEL